MKSNKGKTVCGSCGKVFGAMTKLGAAVGILALGGSTVHAGLQGFDLGDAANYAVIFQGGGGNQLNINNPSGLFANTDTGNIGIAGTGQLAVSGPLVINGRVDFAGAVNEQGGYNNGGNVTINGPVTGGHANVQNDMNSLNALSTMLGGEAGMSVALSAGETINAASGTLDALGNKVFTVSSINAPNGNLTINGDGSHKVVFNISAGADSNIHFDNIILTGGLTPDDVLFNLFGGDNVGLTGGPTLDLNSNGGTLNGVFLDPNGQVSLVHTILDGRIFGGDTHNEQLVSGGTLVSPPSPPSVPDNGSTLILLGVAGVGLVGVGSKFRFGRG